MFNSGEIKEHLHKIGINPLVDLSNYTITHDCFTKYDYSNNKNIKRNLNVNEIETAVSTCTCGDDVQFLGEVEALKINGNCKDGGILDDSLYFGLGLFSNCPNISCTPTSATTCNATCPLVSGCGVAVGEPVSSLQPYIVSIPGSPGSLPFKFGVTYSYFSPQPVGADCSFESIYPSQYNKSQKFAFCMLKVCITNPNPQPGDLSSCQCAINANTDDLSWSGINNQIVEPNDLFNGSYLPLSNTIATGLGFIYEGYCSRKL